MSTPSQRTPLHLVVLGLSLSSAWGNGHATTYRALLKAFAEKGHRVTFLERDVDWYAGPHRDLAAPDFCELIFYRDLDDLRRHATLVRNADAVMVGSYVPDGIEVGGWAQATARGPTVFYDIDTPVTLNGLATGGIDYLSEPLIPGYAVYFSFTGGPTLGRLEQQYGSPAARALYCSVDADVYRPLWAEKRWDLSYLGTYSPDRQPMLEQLLLEPARRAPDRRFVVAGSQYPEDIVWPVNVERLQHVAPIDHPSFYAASRFTLNVTRVDMVQAGWSPSVRLFEAAACGSPLISDVWEGLESLLLAGSEIRLAEDANTVLQILALPETAREAQAQAARTRILAAHTSIHRAETLEQELRAAIQRTASSKAASKTLVTGNAL